PRSWASRAACTWRCEPGKEDLRMSAATTVPWDRLIEADRVHGSLYTDPAVWEAELERIWYRTWVYVGHESEVPEPNDYVLKSIGPQPVIMTRDRQGGIHLLLNRCSHRANLVCDAPQGNSSAFRCPYHGWTFANTGALLGYPFSSGYGGRELKGELGLARVPRIESYQGFVFGSFAEGGPTLAEHLGAAAGEIDRLVRLSPEGRIQLTAGWLQHKVKANWKMLLENETDGYHPQFVHAEIQIFVLQPLAVDETVQHVTAIQFAGAPDLNRRMLQQTIGSVGPAGFLLADDSEMYERNQRGVQTLQPEWLVLKRGLHRQRLDDDGHLIGDATDEVPMRAMWAHYRSLMEDGR